MSRPNPTSPREARPNLYGRVTAAIVADLERGVRPWTKPWSVGRPGGGVRRPLRHNGQAYAGINIVLLWGEAAARGFTSPTWMTFRQALELGGHVRKGETGSTVVYADRVARRDTDHEGRDIERRFGFLKAYTVFNVEQIEALPDRFSAVPAPQLNTGARVAQAESFIVATGAKIRHGGDSAYYAPGPDYVQSPPFEAFADPEAYYATLAHELTHWTRHPTRLDRNLGGLKFGDQGYAREELVAELGAAFLCADLGLELHPREDHAAYLASWLQVLEVDKRFLFTAAAHAQRACDFLHALQPVS